MKKTVIKNKADLQGFTTDLETDTLLSFSKAGKAVVVDAKENRITTIIGSVQLYNFVTEETIEAVAKRLLR